MDRADVVATLAAADAPLVAVTAPAGYGKTTTVLQWDHADTRSFAWVSLDRLDDDPVHLVHHIGRALDVLAPIDAEVQRNLETPGRLPERDLLPILTTELTRRSPLVLVLDDVHVLTNEVSQRCIERLVDAVPRGSTIAVVGRSMPTIRLPRRRMDGTVCDVDADMLAFSTAEASALFDGMQLDLSATAVADLVSRTEGWAGGLHLAALGLAGRRDPHHPGLNGRDRLVADYLVEEVLGALPTDLVHFLEQSSVLERMSAPLLDELLQIDSSGAQLRAIEASGNLFLVPLDGERRWYRYHHLFGELLRARLRERDPRASAELHRRASAILEDDLDLDGAIHHAVAGGDTDRALALAVSHAPKQVLGGRVGVLARWLDRIGEPVNTTVTGAMALAWLGIGLGDVTAARAAIDTAIRDGGDDLLPDGVSTVVVAMSSLRALAAPQGLEGILADTDLVLREGSESMRPWWSLAACLRGTALSMMGDVDGATALLEQARAGVTGLPALAAGAEAHLALLALDRGDLAAAAGHTRAARRLRQQHALEGLTTATVVFAADALVSARLGNRPDALREAAIARDLVARLDGVVPRSALLNNVVLARACLLVDDRAEANRYVKQADRARAAEPLATRINRELEAIHEALDAANRAVAGGPALTPAELRVLPYLATHLSLKEIAAELIISRNTAKSHAVAIYRKLGATSRSEAVSRAVALGLLQR